MAVLTPEIIKALARQTIEASGASASQRQFTPEGRPGAASPRQFLPADDGGRQLSKAIAKNIAQRTPRGGSSGLASPRTPRIPLWKAGPRRPGKKEPEKEPEADEAEKKEEGEGGKEEAEKEGEKEEEKKEEKEEEKKPKRVVTQATFDRLHNASVAKRDRWKQRRAMADREIEESVCPPTFNEKSMKIAGRKFKEPMIQRSKDFLKAREEKRERGAALKLEKESEELTHRPEITSKASNLVRNEDDWEKWDEKRQEKLTERHARRTSLMNRECTFTPTLTASGKYAHKIADQPVIERLTEDARNRQAARDPGPNSPKQRTRKPAARGKEETPTPRSARASTSHPVSFEDFMHNKEPDEEEEDVPVTPARPLSAGAGPRPKLSRAVQFGEFRATVLSLRKDDEPLQATTPRASVLQAGTPRASVLQATPRASDCFDEPHFKMRSSLGRPPRGTMARPTSARAHIPGPGENYVNYSPEIANLLMSSSSFLPGS